MDAATGFYLNVYDHHERPSDPARDVFVIFNEANSAPTQEELNVLSDLVEKELEKNPSGESLQTAIEDSGLECVTFGVQIQATGLNVPPCEPPKKRRGRKSRVELHDELRRERIQKAKQCLMDNGLDEDDAHCVLQAIGYILLDEELFPESD